MKIDSFVFNWLDYAPASERLEQVLRPLSNAVHVINSGPPHPGWVNLDPQNYFTSKWQEALKRFTGDVLFNIQADVTVPDMAALFAAAEAAFRTGQTGMYAPNVAYTYWMFDPVLLPRYADGLHAVPQTDTLCWFLDSQVIRGTRYPLPEANRYGWGLDALSVATCLRLGVRVVRDYRLRVDHPQGTGYSSDRAFEELQALLRADPAAAVAHQIANSILVRHWLHHRGVAPERKS